MARRMWSKHDLLRFADAEITGKDTMKRMWSKHDLLRCIGAEITGEDTMKRMWSRDELIDLLSNTEPPEPPEPVTGDNYVRFVSAEARTITPKYTNSGVTLQYSVDSGATWTTISSGSATTSATEHWFRGRATGAKSLFMTDTTTNAWSFSGSSDLAVYGNLNYLLCDTLGDEEAPTSLGTYAYAYMFNNCASLTTAPELPATTLANDCYNSMFKTCTSLTTAPELPATTMASFCYLDMFYNCTAFKVSETKTGSYTYAWRIPTSGTGTTASSWNNNMLHRTGGTFTDNPTINMTYYVENKPV